MQRLIERCYGFCSRYCVNNLRRIIWDYDSGQILNFSRKSMSGSLRDRPIDWPIKQATFLSCGGFADSAFEQACAPAAIVEFA